MGVKKAGIPLPAARIRSASVPCGQSSTAILPVRYCRSSVLLLPRKDMIIRLTWPFSVRRASPPRPSAPALLDTAVREWRESGPLRRSAAIRVAVCCQSGAVGMPFWTGHTYMQHRTARTQNSRPRNHSGCRRRRRPPSRTVLTLLVSPAERQQIANALSIVRSCKRRVRFAPECHGTSSAGNSSPTVSSMRRGQVRRAARRAGRSPWLSGRFNCCFAGWGKKWETFENMQLSSLALLR